MMAILQVYRHPMRVACAAVLAGALTLAGGPAAGQEAAVAVDENVRSEPNGTVIAELRVGTPVTILDRQGGWSRVTFGGVVWIPSLQRRDGGAFDLIVSADEGENLREEPSGRILGRLNPGTLLEEVDRVPGWVRVRRTAWIWSESLDRDLGTSAGRTPSPEEPIRSGEDPSASGSVWIRIPDGDLEALLATPDGDTLARAFPGAEVQVIQRDGSWVRVRLEGWLWLPDGATPEESGTEAVLRGVAASEIVADPERFRGRVVELEVQFISLERAEAVRADFREGEPFLLTRSMEAGRTFVYLAVSPEELERVSALNPLDRLTVVGRVRAGAAALTGNPVLDLLELRVQGR